MQPARELLPALYGNETDGFPYSPNGLKKSQQRNPPFGGNRGSSSMWRKTFFCRVGVPADKTAEVSPGRPSGLDLQRFCFIGRK